MPWQLSPNSILSKLTELAIRPLIGGCPNADAKRSGVRIPRSMPLVPSFSRQSEQQTVFGCHENTIQGDGARGFQTEAEEEEHSAGEDGVHDLPVSLLSCGNPEATRGRSLTRCWPTIPASAASNVTKASPPANAASRRAACATATRSLLPSPRRALPHPHPRPPPQPSA